MTDLLSLPMAHVLTLALLHFLWQGALVAIGLRVFLAFARSANSCYAASLAALVVMLCFPIATCIMLAQAPSADFPAVTLHGDEAFAPFSIDGAATTQSSPGVAQSIAALQLILLAGWLVGVMVLSARLVTGYVGTLWLRGGLSPLPTRFSDRLVRLEKRLGVVARGRVFLSNRIDEAMAIGCLRPLVLLPLAWMDLPPSVVEAVIAHELAHIRRLDLWATWLQRLAETLLFYHPAVWWISRRMSVDRELCCDELAVEATSCRGEYAKALETIARRKCSPPVFLSTSFGGGNMSLLQRVRSVLSGGSREPLTWSTGAAACLAPLLAFAALASWSPLHATANAQDAKAPVKNEVDEPSEKNANEGKEKVAREEKGQADKKAGAQEEQFNLDKFQPENEREKHLLAVIHQLQSEIAKTRQIADDIREIKDKLEYKAKSSAADQEAAHAKKAALIKEQSAAHEKEGVAKKEKRKEQGEAPKKTLKEKGLGEAPKKEFSKEDVLKKPVNKGDHPKKEFVKGEGQKDNGKSGKEPTKEIRKGDGQKDPVKKADQPKKEFVKGEDKDGAKKGEEPKKPFAKGEGRKESVKKEFIKGEGQKDGGKSGKEPTKEIRKGGDQKEPVKKGDNPKHEDVKQKEDVNKGSEQGKERVDKQVDAEN
jgi:beta-lactamase regulating signal transducer with metallopeptidase domain